MRHLRPFTALLAMAAIAAACSSTPGASSGGESSQGSEPSTGSQPSQAAATTGGGGGGGVGGANGSITYEITGDYEASGELPFQPLASVFEATLAGWSASFAAATGGTTVISLNTASAGQIFSFGDGTAVVTGVSDAGSGNACTFTFTKNDASGLAGHIECSNAQVIQESGISQASLTAEFDAHP